MKKAILVINVIVGHIMVLTVLQLLAFNSLKAETISDQISDCEYDTIDYSTFLFLVVDQPLEEILGIYVKKGEEVDAATQHKVEILLRAFSDKDKIRVGTAEGVETIRKLELQYMKECVAKITVLDLFE